MHAQNIVGMRLMSECYGIKASEIMGRHRKYPFSLKKKIYFYGCLMDAAVLCYSHFLYLEKV